MQFPKSIPALLFKIISIEQWEESKNYPEVPLGAFDRAFIHLATAEQLDKIAVKFWHHVPAYMLLTLASDRLPGKLEYEVNPGGNTRYYHLYEGSIPHSAIVEARPVKQLH